MVDVTHPTIPIGIAPSRADATSVAARRAGARTHAESCAAPLTLAAVVIAALLLAVAIALVGALGA